MSTESTAADIDLCGITIYPPDESSAVFSISEDLAGLLGTDYQTGAIATLRAQVQHLRPRPQFDHEADLTEITSRNVETILEVAATIARLRPTGAPPTESEIDSVRARLRSWKRPKRQRWTVGDSFGIPLNDGGWGLGQIVGTHLTGRSPVCALFEHRGASPEVALDDLLLARVIAVLNTDGSDLDRHTFPVLDRFDPLADPSAAKAGQSIGDGILPELLEAWFGLRPWNVMADQRYYDRMLRAGVTRPTDVVILDDEARAAYRRREFRVDESGGYLT